jgi:hypothetical protein
VRSFLFLGGVAAGVFALLIALRWDRPVTRRLAGPTEDQAASIRAFHDSEVGAPVPISEWGKSKSPHAGLGSPRLDKEGFRALASNLKQLKELYEGESRDYLWSRDTTSAIEAAAENLPQRAYYDDMTVDCRSTLCKISASVPMAVATTQVNQADWGSYMSVLIRSLGDMAPVDDRIVIYEVDPDQTPITANFSTYLHRRQ